MRAAELLRDGFRFLQICAGQARRDRRHGDGVVSQLLMRHDCQQRAIDTAE